MWKIRQTLQKIEKRWFFHILLVLVCLLATEKAHICKHLVVAEWVDKDKGGFAVRESYKYWESGVATNLRSLVHNIYVKYWIYLVTKTKKFSALLDIKIKLSESIKNLHFKHYITNSISNFSGTFVLIAKFHCKVLHKNNWPWSSFIKLKMILKWFLP